MEESEEVEVAQGGCEIIFTKGLLKTDGVGPCIAIIVHGIVAYPDRDEEAIDNVTENFIALYHFEDEYYQLSCLSLNDPPAIEELSKNHNESIPILIKCDEKMWIYGLNLNGIPQLTEVENKEPYRAILFTETPKKTKINEEIYKAIGETKAHSEYFSRTHNGLVEKENNFNYCVSIMRKKLTEKIFRKIVNEIDELEKIEITQVELVGGQLADDISDISGTEMQAKALEESFKDPTVLAKCVQDDCNEIGESVTVDFSHIKVSTDNLLKATGECFFDIKVYLTDNGMKVESTLMNPKANESIVIQNLNSDSDAHRNLEQLKQASRQVNQNPSSIFKTSENKEEELKGVKLKRKKATDSGDTSNIEKNEEDEDSEEKDNERKIQKLNPKDKN